MSSLATGSTAIENLQQAIAMPEPPLTRAGNNSNSASAKGTRKNKFEAIVGALRQMNAAHSLPPNILDGDGDIIFDHSRLENQDWEGASDTYNQLSANDQTEMLNHAIAQANLALEADGGSPGYVPQSPQYGFSQPGTPRSNMSDFDRGGNMDMDMDMDMDEDDNSKQTPPPVQQMPQPSAPAVQPIAPPPVALTNIVDTNAFGPYQRRVEEAMAAIREIGRGQTFQEMQIQQLEAIIRNVYEVFFGVDYATGQPTPFHIQHGAAPIAGMSLPEVVTQARTAQEAQREQQRMQESVFGFFRTFLQPLIRRRSQLEQQGNRMSDHAWSQRGADTGLSDPLSIIAQLMAVLQDVHVAGALLVRSDPLFIANRSERAQQGHLRVRGFWGGNTYAVARAGYSVLRNVIGAITPAIAVQMDSMMPAAYRSGSLAIMNFERALARFDHLYQNLPSWARLCWTLPFSRASPNYRAELPRWQNKPGAQQAEQAIQQRNFQLLMMARGSITEHFDPATYMAALTTNAVPIPGSNPPRFQTVVNGPLLAYYYALHGGRMLYLRQGREWLQLAFLQNPARFIQELANLRDTMAHIHSRFPRRHGQERGAPVIAEGSAEQQDARMLMDRNVPAHQRAAAEQRLQAYFRRIVGTGQIGTTHVAVPAHLCRRQEPPATCAQRLRNQGQRLATAIQQSVNPQYSSQEGAQPIGVEALTQGMDPQARHEWNQQMAAVRTAEVGQQQANLNQSRAELDLTRQLLRGLRAAARSALQGDTTPLMQLPTVLSVANLRNAPVNRLQMVASSLIGEPNGLLAILNSPVYLYTRASDSRYTRGQPNQLFRILDNYFGYRPIDYAQLEQILHTVGTTFINAAIANDSIQSNNEQYALDANTVHNIALRILENDYWRRLLGMSQSQINTAITNIRRHGRFRGGLNQGRTRESIENPEEASNNNRSRGGRKRKKTRKHKKKKKKTRRRKMKRKRTKHHRKRKKHTRKH